MFKKNAEDLNRSGLEFEPSSVAREFAGVKIHFKWPEANFLLLADGHGTTPSDEKYIAAGLGRAVISISPLLHEPNWNSAEK